MNAPGYVPHAIDFASTGGPAIRWILNDPEVMQILDGKLVPETGFSVGDHVRCCIAELDKFDKEWESSRC